MKNHPFKPSVFAGAGCALLIGVFQVSATPNFGSLPAGVTFDGASIATGAAGVNSVDYNGCTISLGMECLPGGFQATLPNNCAGTSFSPIGTARSSPDSGLWSFEYYINVSRGSAANYTYNLIIGNGTATVSSETLTPVLNNTRINYSRQSSQNLGEGFLSVPLEINPNANNVYTFDLQVSKGGDVIGNDFVNVDLGPVSDTPPPDEGSASSRRIVDVGSVSDTANTFILTGLVVTGLVVSRRKLAVV